MPNFKTEGTFPNDSISVRAIMLWPNDAERRRHYYAADYANGFIYEGPASSVYPWEGSLIRALLEAPSWSELKRESEQRTRRGVVAGYIFMFMFLMDKMKDKLPKRGAKGASLSKAKFLARQWARTGATYGDGVKMNVSEDSVDESWENYRSVAHLWAAAQMNRLAEFAPPNKIFHADHLHAFLRAAAYMQMFGTTLQLDNRSRRPAPETLLPASSAWLIDVSEHRPAIMLPDDWSVLDDTPFMTMLRDYRA